jgi:hypothetical protein
LLLFAAEVTRVPSDARTQDGNLAKAAHRTPLELRIAPALLRYVALAEEEVKQRAGG